MDRIGEYLVKNLIGEGGMGKVYAAEERLSKRQVALKVLRPELGRSEKGRELFLNEMTILAHFDHPNIVRCLSCAEIDGELVMTLELLDGETLRDRLGDVERLSWPEAVDIVVQVASALEATHGQEPPIIHRDLKPENLMLVGDGQVKVMDFGIATAMHAMSKNTTHSVGTLQYMSPEQIDAAEIDARSDIYGLGLIFYELLVGHPPFESESPRELLNMQCADEPPELPATVRRQLPKGVERMLFSMLAKKPADRPDSATAIIKALEPFATADRPTSAGVSAAPAAAIPPRSSAEATSEAPRAVVSTPKAPARSDTIALLERASAPRQIPTGLAVLLLVVACAAAGLGTYLIRSGSSGEAPASEVSARTERAG